MRNLGRGSLQLASDELFNNKQQSKPKLLEKLDYYIEKMESNI